jgi:hypothetical protein
MKGGRSENNISTTFLSSINMDRTLYVLVYPSRLFAAHWSFWLPYLDDNGHETEIGDRPHATGDRLNGFEYEYVQDYNVKEDDRHSTTFPIGLISATHLSEDGAGSDVEAGTGVLNAFDKACREVPAPDPSLNKVTSTDSERASGVPPKRVQVRDCQWWIKQTTARLVETGMLLPLDNGADGPIERVEGLPKH